MSDKGEMRQLDAGLGKDVLRAWTVVPAARHVTVTVNRGTGQPTCRGRAGSPHAAPGR
jgi:hypothetical protein